MNIDFQPGREPVTPEHVLAVFRDEYRQQQGYDPEAEPGYCLSAESSVADWRDACNLVGWRDLGHALNESWGIDVPDAEWFAILEPSGERSLDGVAAVIARQAGRRPVIRPAHLLGATCLSAGAFLTIRSLVQKAGAEADVIAPSTPLAAYTRQYSEVFLSPIARLAPGALPAVRIRTPTHDAGVWMLLAGLPLFLVGWVYGLTFMKVVAVSMSLGGWLITWAAARYIRPASVSFGEIETFGDLARVVAAGSPGRLLEADDGSVVASQRAGRWPADHETSRT